MLKHLRIALSRKMVCGVLLRVNLSKFELVNRLMKFAASAFSARLFIASCWNCCERTLPLVAFLIPFSLRFTWGHNPFIRCWKEKSGGHRAINDPGFYPSYRRVTILSSHAAVEHCEMCLGQTSIPSGFYLKELTENVNERRAGNETMSNVAESNLICSHDSLKK